MLKKGNFTFEVTLLFLVDGELRKIPEMEFKRREWLVCRFFSLDFWMKDWMLDLKVLWGWAWGCNSISSVSSSEELLRFLVSGTKRV